MSKKNTRKYDKSAQFVRILTSAEKKHSDWLKYSETGSDWLAEFAAVKIWIIFHGFMEDISRYVYNNSIYFLRYSLPISYIHWGLSI